MAQTQSHWRREAEIIVAATLALLPDDATEKDKRKALRDSYPWGERRMHPYKVWCEVVRAALGSKPKPKPEVPLPTPMPTGDTVADALLAALREDPTDTTCIGALADRCEERGHDFWARRVRGILQGAPEAEKVAQRLWPKCRIVHMTRSAGSAGYMERREIQRSQFGGFICTIRDLEDQIAGRTLLVDPAVTEAVALERAAAVLSLFSAETIHA